MDKKFAIYSHSRNAWLSETGKWRSDSGYETKEIYTSYDLHQTIDDYAPDNDGRAILLKTDLTRVVTKPSSLMLNAHLLRLFDSMKEAEDFLENGNLSKIITGECFTIRKIWF